MEEIQVSFGKGSAAGSRVLNWNFSICEEKTGFNRLKRC